MRHQNCVSILVPCKAFDSKIVGMSGYAQFSWQLAASKNSALGPNKQQTKGDIQGEFQTKGGWLGQWQRSAASPAVLLRSLHQQEITPRHCMETIPMQIKHARNCAKQGCKFVVDFAQILGKMRPVELDTDQLAAVQVQTPSQQCPAALQ